MTSQRQCIVCLALPAENASGVRPPGGDLVQNNHPPMSSARGSLLVWTLLAIVPVTSGCQLIFPGRLPDGPKPRVPQAMPREQAKVSLPDYIIEPPDVLTIETLSLVPKAPYHLRVFDVLTINSAGLSAEEPIAGDYPIQPNGMIELGHSYGPIQAAGHTTEELQTIILAKLAKLYTSPSVWVTLHELGARQQIAGEHLVAPDGKVNLGTYGRVRVVGMTIEEAQAAVQEHLSQYLEQPEIAIDVLGYNSKVYYVVTQGAGFGDQVVILPARGNETVIDAIGQVQGLQSTSSTRMWIARPGHNDCGGDQILPIDWLAVTQRGDTTTNYQIMPGDRLYVSEDKLVAFDTALGKLISPVERVLGVTLLGTNTAQRIVFFKQSASNGGGNGP